MTDAIKQRLAAGVMAAMCLLAGCGKGKAEPPEAYAIGENSTVPLDSCIDEEEGGRLASITAPEEPEEGEETDEAAAEEAQEPVYTYTYKKLPVEAIQRYADKLMSEDEGFALVSVTQEEEEKEQEGEEEAQDSPEEKPQDGTAAEDEPLELPSELSSKGGSLCFTRPAVEEGRLFSIAVTWEKKTCTVEVSCPEGGDTGEEEAETETIDETVAFVSSLSPSLLGLPGSSMSEYNIYAVEGNALVDGMVCRQINVYQLDEQTQTNTFIGAYLIAKRQIYRLDEEAGTVELLN